MVLSGGAILFNSPYVLRTVASFKETGKEADVADYLTATRINNTPSESIGQAVILTTNGGKFTDLSSVEIDTVVGVSWYAAAKIMEEVAADKNAQNALTSTLFTVAPVDPSRPSSAPNKAKIALIAFIQGTYAYGIVSDGIVEKPVTFKEKYDAVVEYIKTVDKDGSKGKERGHIQGIWNALMEQYELGKASNISEIVTNLDYTNIERFLQTPAASAPLEDENPSPAASEIRKQPKLPTDSLGSLESLFQIPTKFPIHTVLGTTK